MINKKVKIIIFLLSLFFINLKLIFAETKILINEFLIDPQPQQVEILNYGTDVVDVSGWIIDDSGGTTFYTIPKNNIINPDSCLVFSSDFNLNKTSSDTIRLIKDQDIIDSFSYKSSSGSGISYIRIPDDNFNWSTSSASLGLFNQTGESCLAEITPTLTVVPDPITTNVPTPTLTFVPTIIGLTSQISNSSIKEIYLSEVMVNSKSEDKEWVELYNNNDFTVNLNNWYIDDVENSGSAPKIFSLEIPAKSYRTFQLTSAMFNNQGDSVRLLDANKLVKDDFEYSSSNQEKTWGRINFDNDNYCQQEPSLERVNSDCIILNTSPTLTTLLTKSPTSVTIVVNNNIKNTNSKNNSEKDLNNWNKNNNSLPKQKLIINTSNNNQGDVLGISFKDYNFKVTLLIKLLNTLSFCYSLLTIISILIKIKFIYGQYKKILPTFFYSFGKQ